MIKNILYNRNLSDAWFDYLLPYDKFNIRWTILFIIHLI
jgi:hypothetical protein